MRLSVPPNVRHCKTLQNPVPQSDKSPVCSALKADRLGDSGRATIAKSAYNVAATGTALDCVSAVV